MEDVKVLEGCDEGEEQPSGKSPRDLQQGRGHSWVLGAAVETKLKTGQQKGAGEHKRTQRDLKNFN